MTIANRLLAGFLVGVALMLLVGMLALSQIRTVRDEVTQIVSNDFEVYHQLDHIRDVQASVVFGRLTMLNHYWAHDYSVQDAAPVDLAVSRWTSQAHVVEEALLQAQASASRAGAETSSQQRQQMYHNIATTLRQTLETFRQSVTRSQELFVAIRENDAQNVRQRSDAITHDEEQIDALISEVTISLENAVKAGQLTSVRMYNFSRNSLYIGLASALLVALVVTFWTRRSIIEPLAQIMRVMEQVGQGNLATRVKLASSVRIRDEVSRLAEGLNRMIEGLGDIAKQSRKVTDNLDSAIAEIRASTQQQAASVEQQFAAVQETAATVDQITHSGAQMSRRARELIESAQLSVSMSAQGLDAVAENTRSMTSIHTGGEAVAANIVALSERTDAIGEIITAVNDLSERSHLLALNAAIEAAAAGEHGRSFAVVAAEMKLLADQSRDATRNVRVILGDIQRGINTSVMLTEESVKRVTAGRAQMELASRTIERMAAGIEESVHAFEQIVASTNQQQIGIEQVMAALQSIRQASQQTASGTRNLDSSASNLGGLSRQLLALSDRYRT